MATVPVGAPGVAVARRPRDVPAEVSPASARPVTAAATTLHGALAAP